MSPAHVLHISLPLFDSTTRLYELSFRHAIPNLGSGGLLVEAFAAGEALHEVNWRDLIVLSTNAHIPLKTLIAQPATLHVSLADGTRTSFSGLVNQAALLGSDGGFARYRLRLVPWIWVLSQSATSRVWQDTSTIDIVESVFAGHAMHAAWTWSADAVAFLRDARQRGYCNQYRETDLAFVTRILAEEGIAWRVEEHADSPAGHRLVLFADSTQDSAVPEDATSAGALGGAGIRYHGARTMEIQDSVCALGNRRVFHSARTTVAGYHPDTKRVITASVPTREGLGGARAPLLEACDFAGVDSFANHAEAERYARLHMEALEARRERWQGRSTVRTLRPGTRFSLTGTPLSGHDTSAPWFAVTRVVSVGINNLPKPARESIAELFGPLPELLQECLQPATSRDPDVEDRNTASHDAWTNVRWDEYTAACHDDELFPLAALIEQAEQLGYANRFDAITATIPWRPLLDDGTGCVLNAKPRALGSQTAIVVGPDGCPTPNGADEIHCDRHGRIRIRFHWQGEHGDGTATCWVRVAQRWAGTGFGAQFLPRIGQEVLVRFLDNDIDRPIVVAALYNGQGEGGVLPTPGGRHDRQADRTVFESANDHTPSAQGNLAAGHSPVWHGASAGADGHRNPAAQWGIRSKEFGGYGYNQLVFDDTDSQGRIQLKSTQYGSQLELGHLIHTADNYRGSFRGLGFELRTDAYGAIRAGKGLLLSTFGIVHNATTRDPAGDNVAGIAHLKQAASLAEHFSHAATSHKTVALAGHTGTLQANASAIDDTAAPVQALLKAASGMVSNSSLDAASEDAANKVTMLGADKIPHTTDPVIAIAARAGLGLAAGQNLQMTVGETAHLMNGGDSQFITGERLRMHTGQAIGLLAGAVAPGENGVGLQMIAAHDDIGLQAQNGTADVKAAELIDIISANSHIDWAAATRISISTEGGANITIANGNITVQCPGKILIQAGKKSLSGPAKTDYPLPTSPGHVCISCLLKAKAQGSPLVAKNA